MDYVLKPIQEDRLQTTIERLKERIEADDKDAPTLPDNMSQLIATLKREMRSGVDGAPEYMRWIKASLGSTLKLIDVKDVCSSTRREIHPRRHRNRGSADPQTATRTAR